MFRVSRPHAALLAAAGLLTTTLSSCLSLDSQPDTCTSDVVAPTSSVVSPATGQVGTAVDVRYTIQIVNGCGKFKALGEQSNGKHIYLSPVVSYQGCSCPQVISDYNGTFKFTPSQTGQYVFHFLKANNVELTDTLTVQ